MTTYGHERGVRMNFYANNCMCVENGDNGLYEDDEIYDHYVGDVQMLVENGFDGVKVDACGQRYGAVCPSPERKRQAGDARELPLGHVLGHRGWQGHQRLGLGRSR
mmetsp:Transcript_42271/g.116931  ORF Transcript_42271/g.116931 Transcript_42271/m.116931 type:complete len:106 (-) Transcript_42271:4895-5212(-)